MFEIQFLRNFNKHNYFFSKHFKNSIRLDLFPTLILISCHGHVTSITMTSWTSCVGGLEINFVTASGGDANDDWGRDFETGSDNA
jgi:hypothetical protein